MVQSALPQLILLFVTDQFRQDAFQPPITPNLYKLSLDPDATTFTNAYVSTPTCTPSRASLLTGKSPWAHGMLGYAYTVNCQEYPTTLPSMLSELRGYDTFAVGKNHFGWNSTGDYVTHGFQHLKVYDAMSKQPHVDDYEAYYNTIHPGMDPLDVTCHHLGYNDWKACPYGSEEEAEHPTAWTTRRSLDYLKRFNFSDPENKMFLKVSYHRPHSPYDPPRRLLEKYLTSKMLVPKRFINNTSWDANFLNITPMEASDWHGDPGDEAAHHTRAGYLASVDFVDEGVGEILEWLRSQNTNGVSYDNTNNNLLDSSMILWTSDHGDMNGDHNLWRKGYAYEGSSHVNLIVKVPSIRKVGDGTDTHVTQQQQQQRLSNQGPRTSPALVETRDIAVTIYDYLGILDQVKSKDPLVNGLSLMSVLEAGDNHKHRMVRQWLDLEHAVVYQAFIHWNAIVGFHEAEFEGDDGVNFTHNTGGESQGDARRRTHEYAHSSSSVLLWKYIFYALDGSEQLFCLSNDPNETIDLSKKEQWSHILIIWRNTMVAQFEGENRGTDWVKDGKLSVRTKSMTYGPNFPCAASVSPE